MQEYIVKEIDLKDWKLLLNKSQFSSPFQTPQYFSFLKETDNTDGEVLGFITDNDFKALVVVTIMKEKGLKGFFSRRGIIFGGPVLSDDITNEELSFFFKQVSEKLKGKAIYLETRNFFDYTSYKEVFMKAGWYYEPYLNFQLSLKGIEKDKILSLFKYNRRREIRQSLKQGVTYGSISNEAEIKEIYKILEELYRTRVKVPLPSLDYFLSLYRKEIIKVFIVKHEDKLLGGSFCPVLENRGLYTYYYCGIRGYHKRIFPTHLAVLAAMEYAVDNNIPMMDFMGAGKPEVDYGVRKYKSEFGGELVEHGRFIKVLNPIMYKLGVMSMKILKRM